MTERIVETTTKIELKGDRCTIAVSATGVNFDRQNISTAMLDLDEFDAIAAEVARYRRLIEAMGREDAA